MAFHRDNHYVPRVYLKHFASSKGRVFAYRVLVSHAKVPTWKEPSTRGVAYQEHLYTRIAAGGESDEIEKWLGAEFETPVEETLRKVTADERLLPSDWRHLVRFMAAQYVRTPARLLENLKRWPETLPSVLENAGQTAVRQIELAKASGVGALYPQLPNEDYLPFRVTTIVESGQELGTLKTEIIPGRGLWLFTIRHHLTKTLNVLHNYRWTILAPHDDLEWFTSDDPVICLNYYKEGRYDFKGGWGNPGTEIFLPLSPRHLLYTRIGEKPPPRGHKLPHAKSGLIRRLIAEHAHRIIFASSPDPQVPKLCPRIENALLLSSEAEQWRRWHCEQTAAERELMGWNKR